MEQKAAWPLHHDGLSRKPQLPTPIAQSLRDVEIFLPFCLLLEAWWCFVFAPKKRWLRDQSILVGGSLKIEDAGFFLKMFLSSIHLVVYLVSSKKKRKGWCICTSIYDLGISVRCKPCKWWKVYNLFKKIKGYRLTLLLLQMSSDQKPCLYT